MWNKLNQKKLTPQQKFLKENQEAELRRQQLLVKTKLLPFFAEESADIEDALTFLVSFSQAIEQGFAVMRSSFLVKDLKLEEKMKLSKEAQRYKKLLTLIEDEPIGKLDSMLRQLKDEINRQIQEEIKGKKLL